MTLRVRRPGLSRLRVLVVAVAAVTVFVAGCSRSGSIAGTSASDSGSAHSGGAVAAGGGPGGIGDLVPVVSAAIGNSGSSGGAGGAAAGPTRTVAADETLLFVTPSKNIGCALSKEGVRCDVRDHTWVAPARPASCDLDYGNGLFLGATGPADYVCAGDTVVDVSNVQLGYGASVVAGDFICLSETGGVTCRNTASGRGLTLSRQAATRF